MADEYNLCIVARIHKRNWYILVSFSKDFPGEIENLRSVLDNPGPNPIRLKRFMISTEVSKSAKRTVRNEAQRIRRETITIRPVVKGNRGKKHLKEYGVTAKQLKSKQTSKEL